MPDCLDKFLWNLKVDKRLAHEWVECVGLFVTFIVIISVTVGNIVIAIVIIVS